VRLSLLVAAGYFLIVGLAAWFVLDVFVAEVKPGVRKTMEHTLVDSANLLAELVRPALLGSPTDQELVDQPSAGQRIHAALARFQERSVAARIWDHQKHTLDLSLYVTDHKGHVLYATDSGLIGADYSRWNDVYLTLAGHYGARSTRSDPEDEASSIMHVAAPVLADGRIIGVVSLAKPTRSVEPIVMASKDKIRARGFLLLVIAAAIGVAFTWKLSDSIGRLDRYARSVTAGARARPRRSRVRELDDLATALTEMQERLEGKQYVERYLHSLTHELKSPLAAIRGAAELLAEADMPALERARFLANIREQADRLSQVAERLLELARVEQMPMLTKPERLDVAELITQTADALAPMAAQRGICLERDLAHPCRVRGDRFLLAQALSNLLDNAVSFSPENAVIQIQLRTSAQGVELRIRDQGPGIPDYAQKKVFERFFSLPRPDATRKGTGLGLSFVREVAQLHQGQIALENQQPRGLLACLRLPCSES
jgi:two-component system sensor histidine kinase CreC